MIINNEYIAGEWVSIDQLANYDVTYANIKEAHVFPSEINPEILDLKINLKFYGLKEQQFAKEDCVFLVDPDNLRRFLDNYNLSTVNDLNNKNVRAYLENTEVKALNFIKQ